MHNITNMGYFYVIYVPYSQRYLWIAQAHDRGLYLIVCLHTFSTSLNKMASLVVLLHCHESH